MLLASGSIAMLTPVASAAESYSLFGDAQQIEPGNASPHAIQLRSVANAATNYGGIDFVIPPGTTFADFTTLSTDFMFEADDSCGGGSPRFQINVDSGSGDTGNIQVSLGPPPGYTLCPPSVWQTSGDLLEGSNQIDTSQLDGGNFYDPYTAALERYGSYTVTGVQVVADGGWFFTDDLEQTVFIDNTNVNGVIYTYTSAGDLLTDLQASTADLVDNPAAESTLLSALARTQSYLDAGNPFFAYMSMLRYVLLVNRYGRMGIISHDAAQALQSQALQVTRLIF